MKRGVKREKFHFHLGLDLQSYFHPTYALLEDFEIFDYFDKIFSIFRPLKVGIAPLCQKFELSIQEFGQSNTAKQKQWSWQVFWTLFTAFKRRKFFDF